MGRKFRLRNGIVIEYPIKDAFYNVGIVSAPKDADTRWRRDKGAVMIINIRCDGWFQITGGAHGHEYDAMEEV